MSKVTIKDVAREAGVSISTVSNALNDVDVLHPDTKAHILEVAERMHYTPNLNGRNLKARATKTIGLFAGYMGGPYMGALMYSMSRECSEAGYELNAFVTEQKQSIMANLLGRRVDGAVLLNSVLTARQEEELEAAGIPIVYLNKETTGELRASVCFDSEQAGRMAAEYLLARGYRRMGLIEGPDNYDANRRSQGFCRTLKEQGVEVKKEWILQGGFARDLSFEAVRKFLKGRERSDLPEAFFAANDSSAIGCMEALQQAEIKIPDEIAVLGCDDMELSAYVNPALTTIRTNFEEQGTAAVRCLLSLLKEEDSQRKIRLSCKLVERASVGQIDR